MPDTSSRCSNRTTRPAWSTRTTQDRLIADAVSGLVSEARKKARKSRKKQDRKPKGHEGDTAG